MNSNFKLGTWEAAATIGCISIIPILLTIPTVAVESFGTAAFLHNVYTSILVFVILSIIFYLYKNFPSMDIIDLYKYVGGRPLQIISGTLLIIYLLVLSTLTFAEFTQNLQNVVFPAAPQEYICLLFGIIILLSVIPGLRGIFRAGSIIAPLIILGIILMFASLLKDVDFTNFTPIFGNSIKDFWLQGPVRMGGRYEGVFIILLLTSYVKDYKKTGYIAFAIATVLILITVFLLVGILPYPSIIENYLPMFELTRLISYGRFVQRVESIFIFLWLLTTFMYLSVGICFVNLIFQKIYKLQYSHRTLFPFVGIVVASSIILNSFELAADTRTFIFIHLSPYVIYITPIIILILANIKRRHQCKKLILQNSSS